MREYLQTRTHGGSQVVRVEKLIIGMSGGPEKFVHEFTSEWQTVGTLVVSDEVNVSRCACVGSRRAGSSVVVVLGYISDHLLLRASQQPCKLHSASLSACVILSKHDTEDEDFGKVFAIRLPFAISQESSWVWVNALHKHIAAQEILCLDSQISNMYDTPHSNEQYPLLRMLATSSVTPEAKLESPVRALEVPRFTSGIPAALITLVRISLFALTNLLLVLCTERALLSLLMWV